MAKLSFNDGDGVWRTVAGRRIFIRTGESLSSAMKKSGKFKSAKKKGQRKFEDVDKEFHEHAQKMEKNYEEFGGNSVEDERKLNELSRERDKALLDKDKKEFSREELKEKYGTDDVNLINAGKEKEDRVTLKGDKKELNLSQSQKEAGERLNSKAENGVRDDVKAYLSGKENYDGSREDFIRDLSNNWGVDKDKVEEILHNENIKHPRNFTNNQQKSIETISKAEYDKMPNDYKGTLKELVETAEFRGENKQDLIKQYEKMGYDVDKDKTILVNEKGGTILKPVKISDENENNKRERYARENMESTLKGERRNYDHSIYVPNSEEDFIKDISTGYGISREKTKQIYNDLLKKEGNNNQITNALRRKAYQKYLKEHPASKITFENFKDMRKYQ